MALSRLWRWRPWCSIGRSLQFLSVAALALAPLAVQAQQTAGHTATTAVHPRPIIMMTPPARPSGPVAIRRVSPVTGWATNLGRFVSAPRVFRADQFATIRLAPLSDSFAPSLRAPVFFRPFSFGGAFPGNFGYPGSVSQLGGMPLGFGLWPACDSAGTPGVFWTVGPCFGIGDYSAESAASAGNEYPPGAAFSTANLFPIIAVEEQPSSAAAEKNPNAPSPSPTMVLYFRDGKSVPVTDWWVTLGRLQYVTDSGQTSSVDVSQLDLEQTITQNQTRGLEFHLRFTPPSER
jgi:hypothetical protein